MSSASLSGTITRIADATRHVANPHVQHRVPYPDGLTAALSEAESRIAQKAISAWPGYEPTPLLALPGTASGLGLGSLHLKDESGRFGLGSFKALGGAYAVMRHLAAAVANDPDFAGGPDEVTGNALAAGAFASVTQDMTVCCATDGNHGRSVAWGAQVFGCRCVIYVHQTVSQGRVDAIARYGAEVIRHDGNYDDTVRRAAADAAANGWTVVSDTSYEGYLDIPRDVMHGYTVMAREAFEQWRDPTPPTHLVVPGGVGGVAAAVAAAAWWHYGTSRPRMLVVEPTRAACLMESAHRGSLTGLGGDIETVMAGLSCGEPSVLAWQVLDKATDDFVAVNDDQAVEGMRLLAAGKDGDPPVVSGESAASVVAALQLAGEDPSLARDLGLGAAARVLVFSTEGDTDPVLYRELVGRTAAEVLAS